MSSGAAAIGDVISINGHSLVIRNLTRHSAGRYVCRAVNPEGDGVSRPVTLTVRCEYNVRGGGEGGGSVFSLLFVFSFE